MILLNSLFVQNVGVSGSACVLAITFRWQRIKDSESIHRILLYEYPAACVGVG